MARNLSDIAKDIRANWKNIYFGAEPYLQAMEKIHSPEPDAPYFFEDAETQVMYFLANAQYWRGEAAKRIKSELKNNTISNEKVNNLPHGFIPGNGTKLILQTIYGWRKPDLSYAGSCKGFSLESEAKA